MTEKQKEVKKYETVYVAIDGKEFYDEKSCMDYEKSYKGTIRSSFIKQLNPLVTTDIGYGINWSSDDHEAYIIIPQTLDDIVIANAYIESMIGHGSDEICKIDSSYIGKLVMIDIYDDGYWCDVIDLDKNLEHVKRSVENARLSVMEPANKANPENAAK